MVFGAEAFGEVIGFWLRKYPYKKKKREILFPPSLSLFPDMHQGKAVWAYSEKVVIGKPGKSSQQNPTMLAPWAPASSLQNTGKVNVGYLSHTVYFVCFILP